jgi:predicted DNA-binding transcriptional regulator YafY
MANHRFENWELKVLIDAIVSAEFLTDSDIAAITAKIRGLASSDSARLLTRVTPVNHQVKADEMLVKSHIDYLLEAVRRMNKVEFQYQYTDAEMKKKRHKDDFFYVVSPYALTWQDDHYYLIGNRDKYDNLSTYRLDRMTNLAILDQPVTTAATLLGENPDRHIAEYVATAVFSHTGA